MTNNDMAQLAAQHLAEAEKDADTARTQALIGIGYALLAVVEEVQELRQLTLTPKTATKTKAK
jgi:hypothetical protein